MFTPLNLVWVFNLYSNENRKLKLKKWPKKETNKYIYLLMALNKKRQDFIQKLYVSKACVILAKQLVQLRNQETRSIQASSRINGIKTHTQVHTKSDF